ncbi:cystathionine gamma-synthase [Ascosphaera apis ARSEF 7405]|uniref:Cystathionine gamma-synthase n=1 Tax=Ascosphaera apis ARSEF 7405 TaxID=392613 RepID=A0A167XA76_9EURO|nr:cystathionine gamma-synthase [Ascosphaera apis ARSEF 7405]
MSSQRQCVQGGSSTQAIHADIPFAQTSDVAPPIHTATTFCYSSDPDKLVPAADLESEIPTGQYIYSRLSSPNTTRLEAILTSLLHAPSLVYSSGLSAAHAALVCLNPKRVSIGNGYHGVHGVLDIMTRLNGMKQLPLNCNAEELSEGDVVWLETPVNPDGISFNIKEYAEKAHSRGAYLVIDSTFAPPGLQDPFEFGADMVMHSGTKYIGGHSDMLCGVLATHDKKWLHTLAEDRLLLGSVMGSLEGWLGIRSLRTLDVRVARLSQNAGNLVSWIHESLNSSEPSEDDKVIQTVVESITHSSLQKDDMEWLSKQMPNGFGPVFSIVLKTENAARRLPSKLKLFSHATSLGGVESLIEWRAMSDTTVDRRLLRLSIGLENWEDLKADLLSGFKALARESA